jgi:1-acyl-sn-glycerol-3-phosphate acyltransferase
VTAASDPKPKPIPGPVGDKDWARGAAALAIRSIYYGGVMRALRMVFAPTSVVGLDHLNGFDGPCVMVANHSSHADTMVISMALPTGLRRKLVVAAAADYFFTNHLTSTFSTIAIGAIPVDRNRVNRSTLDLCDRLLGEGWSLLLYPEGGRSIDGQMGEFKPGGAWIARRAGVPVLPVHVRGTFDVMPKGRNLPRRSPVTVTFGELMTVADGEDARTFNKRIEAAVADLGES